MGSVSDLLTIHNNINTSVSAEGSENVLMTVATASGGVANRVVSGYENSWVECQHAVLLPDVKQLGTTYHLSLSLMYIDTNSTPF